MSDYAPGLMDMLVTPDGEIALRYDFMTEDGVTTRTLIICRAEALRIAHNIIAFYDRHQEIA